MPAIDSRAVNKEIRLQIKPLLKHEGFSNFTSRSAWRYQAHQIDLVNFQSFNSYHASVLGCTTYSFAVNLGCYLTYVPDDPRPKHPIKEMKGKLMPEDFRCHTRRKLMRQLEQPELERKDIWYVDPKGKYLGPVVHDAALAIDTEGLKWFDQWSDAEAVLLRLQASDDEHRDDPTHGFGRNPSPMRSYLTAYTALFLKRPEIAIPQFQQVLASDSFTNARSRIEQDLKDAMQSSRAK